MISVPRCTQAQTGPLAFRPRPEVSQNSPASSAGDSVGADDFAGSV